MPFLSKAFRLGLSVVTKITDAFNRTTSGSLGTADTGQTWLSTRGTWSANGTNAFTNSQGYQWPLASIELGSTNATVSADVTAGTGVSFWVTDSGSWWAAQSFTLASTTTIPQCIPYNGFSFSASGQCVSGPSFGAGGCFNSSFISSCSQLYNYYNSNICGGSGINNWSCSGSLTTCYESCTATSYTHYLRVVRSTTGNDIGEYASVNVGELPAAIQVNTSGNTITAKAFSNTSLTNQIGSTIQTTPSSPNKGTKHGIMFGSTSWVAQPATLDNFSLEQS